MTNEDPPSGASPQSDVPAGELRAERSSHSSPGSQADPLHAITEGDNVTEAADASRLDLVLDIPVRLSVELGRAEVPIRDVVSLGRGSMIELDRSPGEPLDVRVNGVLIGRGEVVVINEDRLGLRFIEVASQAERLKRLG
jgi:flagellar motor switch protein FliN/FliY